MRLYRPGKVLAVLLIAAGGCQSTPKVATVDGQCADVFHGQVCTWARMQGNTVLSVGATIPMAAIDSAPAEGAMEWPPVAAAVLQLPEAAKRQTGLTHLTMFWEAHGHPPGPYLTPHFDFHFYTIPSTQRAAIDCSDTAKPAALPPAYALPDIPLPPEMAKVIGVPVMVGLCVPEMGMHALLASELQSTTPFRGSMVIGYYDGKPVFLEPMISRAMLDEKRGFDLPIPSVPGLAGRHPSSMHAEYDPERGLYRFEFSGFQAGASGA